MTATRTFINVKTISTHGTSKAAQTALASRRSTPGFEYAIEHVGPRQFAVKLTETIESTPAQVRHIIDGSLITCRCGHTLWYYAGRSLFNLNYVCANCGHEISPVSETGACQ